MPKNTGNGSRLAREAEAASKGKIPEGAFALRGTSVGVFTDARKQGGRLSGPATKK